jgi:hypothetical protein
LGAPGSSFSPAGLGQLSTALLHWIKRHSGGNITAKAIANVAIIHSASTRGERMMLNKIALALALAVTAITVTMSIPASANPKPGSSPESSSYQDSAYNRAGW